MVSALRNTVAGGKALPYAKRVEYIESVGTQWIDLIISRGSNTGVYFDYTLLAGNSNTGLFGSGTVNSSTLYDFKLIIAGGSKQRFDRCDKSSQYANFLPHVGTRQTFTFNPKGSTSAPPYRYYSSLDGAIGQGDTWYQSAYNLTGTTLCVFKAFNRQDLAPAQMRVYDLEFREYTTATDYTVTAHLIPVVDLSRQAKLFDLVSGTYPAHYGTFTPGPEIGGGYKLRCTRRSHRRSSRPSARFWRRGLWKEVA